MTIKKEFTQKDNIVGLLFLTILSLFLARSNFFSFEDSGFFGSFFTTNAVYKSGENMNGPVGALSYIRSLMYIVFPALMWNAYSAKKKANTYVLFFGVVGFVFVKIGLDYFVFSEILNARGEISIIKIIIMSFLLLCIYEGIKRIEFKIN